MKVLPGEVCCIGYREDGAICNEPAVTVDAARGGAVCAAHVPFESPYGVPEGWTFDVAAGAWRLRHEAGFRISVYRVTEPGWLHPFRWDVYLDGRRVAWNVARTRAAAFEAAMPKQATR